MTLRGKTLGVQTGSTAANFAHAYLKGLPLVEYPSSLQLGLELTSGRIDVAVANVIEVKSVIDANPKEMLGLTGSTFSIGALGSGVSNVGLRPDDEKLRAAFDAAMEAVNRDGSNTVLSEKWFGVIISIPTAFDGNGSAVTSVPFPSWAVRPRGSQLYRSGN